MNWLAEAEGCYRAGGVVATEMTQAERMMMRRYGMGPRKEVTTCRPTRSSPPRRRRN
jgi:hypothetical protein